jgi:hypothetical protein
MTTRVPVTVRAVDEMYFAVSTPCGQSWAGMTATDDLQIQVRKAIKHAQDCMQCKEFAQ